MKTYVLPEYLVERDPKRCIRCKVCVNQCTYDTHYYDAEEDVICSRDENCVNCQRCVTFCPTHAITIRKNPNAARENYNWTLGAIRDVKKQAETGGVILTGMGCDKPYFTYWDRLLLNASQVTNPSIDPLREPMEIRTYLGAKPDQLEMELENLRVALEWSRSALGHGEGKDHIVVEAGLRLAGSLWWFWYMRGYLSEGSEWLQIFLEKSSGEPNYARAKALLASGGLAWRQGRIDQAEAACTESLALCRTLGDKFGIAFSLGTLGVVAFLREDYAKAYSFHSEALAIRRELGINRYIAYSLGNLGVVVLAQGGIRQAEGLCEEGLTLSRKSRFQWTFNDLLNKRGIVALARGDYTLAVSLFEQSLSRQQEAGDRWNIAYSLEGIACVAVTQGKPERAAWIWGAAEALREVINSPLPPAYRDIYELFVVAAKASLNEEAFKEVRSEGQEVTMEQAIAFAQA